MEEGKKKKEGLQNERNREKAGGISDCHWKERYRVGSFCPRHKKDEKKHNSGISICLQPLVLTSPAILGLGPKALVKP